MSRIAIKLGLLLASLVLSFVLVELVVRVDQYGWRALSPTLMRSTHAIGTAGLVQRAATREMLYELKPNLDTYYKLVRFQTNAWGMRDHEYPLEKPPGTFRVAVIGDSFSMPAGVELEDAYYKRLEKDLDARFPATRFEFMNFAVDGYQLPQYLATVREKALRFQPDLILIGFCPNDYVWIGALEKEIYAKPYVVLDETNPLFEIHTIPWLAKTVARIRKRNVPKQPWAMKLNDEMRAHVEQHLGEISKLAHASGAKMAVVFLSTFSGGFDVLKALLGELARRDDFTFIDASLAFGVEETREYRIYEADAHPNGEANRMFAELIERELIAHDLVPTGGAR